MLKVAIAQINVVVGAIEANTDLIIKYCIEAYTQQQCDLIVFPELVLTGYPPEDLLFRPELVPRIEKALTRIQSTVRNIDILLGTPQLINSKMYNSAVWIHEGNIINITNKMHLPNYSVFDEKRYFNAGTEFDIVTIKDIPVGILICEDIWYEQPVLDLKSKGAKLIININASPFHIDKQIEREQLVLEHVAKVKIPIIYLNLVGGQDELVFDGGSFVVSADKKINYVAAEFQENLYYCDFEEKANRLETIAKSSYARLDTVAVVYQALVVGVRDYIVKNGFEGVILGLSGGIDSALTLTIVADAIGSNNVEAVMMPFTYTAKMSIDDAQQEAESLGVEYKVIEINQAYNAFIELLTDDFAGTQVDTAEQNLQARCRGVLLMAISNKKKKLVVTTGNKSEMAVGYATLYGDMAGGFGALKDVPKTLVYQLARYRNTISNVIPERVIERAPSAELAPNQQDSDSLPDYDTLDKIIELYVEQDMGLNEIVSSGIAKETVVKIIKMIEQNEHKRRQAAPGVRISRRSFSRDRRYPITSGF
ncbi:NAD synthetase / Glutamine amidotransferase chain of NAD synthetase [hydrothermal vent metagenome]|uniref:NAD(+) synthase (glutamine-hydrolyzing) n=1 Tax=hydrothermal vent metagenome TaxID=652676 RepID=A0A3B1AL23_9ZZZZ